MTVMESQVAGKLDTLVTGCCWSPTQCRRRAQCYLAYSWTVSILILGQLPLPAYWPIP